jgi:hypothetical protein
MGIIATILLFALPALGWWAGILDKTAQVSLARLANPLVGVSSSRGAR